jgi:hypothetical protein
VLVGGVEGDGIGAGPVCVVGGVLLAVCWLLVGANAISAPMMITTARSAMGAPQPEPSLRFE